jgi:RNase P/RNase MRP subunit p29
MAQLTLCFKEKVIEVFDLDETPVTIGRDENNTYVIDSLAVAPKQLKVSSSRHKFIIENTSIQFPAYINGEQLNKISLNQGDKINLQKHVLIFSETNINTLTESASGSHENELEKPVIRSNKASNLKANLQVISGTDIGRVIPLTKAVTEMETQHGVAAIIAKRQSGYFISRLIDDTKIQIDGTDLSNELQLSDGNLLTIDGDQFAYFTEE